MNLLIDRITLDWDEADPLRIIMKFLPCGVTLNLTQEWARILALQLNEMADRIDKRVESAIEQLDDLNL